MSTLTNQIARVDTELLNYNNLPEKLELYSEVINLNVMKVYINSEEFTLTLKTSTNFEQENLKDVALDTHIPYMT